MYFVFCIQGCYPWTYLNPHDPADIAVKMENVKGERETPVQVVPTIETDLEPIDNVLPAAGIDEVDSKINQLHFGHFDIRIPTSMQSSRSSMNQTSSGILEVLNELENEDSTTSDAVKHKSHQDLSAASVKKEESKQSVFKSLLKRTHSAPKKIDVTVRPKSPTAKQSEPDELSPPVHVSCCHPFVDKIKTMADKQLHKNKVPKKPKIKTIAVKDEKDKIVLAEHTRIIRLKESPKAERKNIAAYTSDSTEIVEIIELEESPSESRKRREENRRADEQVKTFVVPENVTQSIDTEPTVDELLEEEFKNDPPKKSPRRSKEHIYEDIQPVDNLTAPDVSVQSILVQKAPQQNAALHETIEANEQQAKQVVEKPEEINEACGSLETELTPPKPVEIIQINVDEAEDIKVEGTACDDNGNHSQESHPKLEAVRDATLSAAEKKVKFSQSTEEYQEKIAAERGPEKEDVELPPEHINKSKWSHMR